MSENACEDDGIQVVYERLAGVQADSPHCLATGCDKNDAVVELSSSSAAFVEADVSCDWQHCGQNAAATVSAPHTVDVVCLGESDRVVCDDENNSIHTTDVSIEFISVKHCSPPRRRRCKRLSVAQRVLKRRSSGVHSARSKLTKCLQASCKGRRFLRNFLRGESRESGSSAPTNSDRVVTCGTGGPRRRRSLLAAQCPSFRFGFAKLFTSRRKRPVIIDGANVAYAHGRGDFSVRGVHLVLAYFERLGHECTVFLSSGLVDKLTKVDRMGNLLEQLCRDQRVVLTPGRRLVDGNYINCYDDRYMVIHAVETGGVIVSRDRFRDVAVENENWKQVVDSRLLIPVFIGDSLILPPDPLGRSGPPLEIFLTFPPAENPIETIVLQ